MSDQKTQDEQLKLRIELATQIEIGLEMDNVIGRMKKLVDDTHIVKGSMEKSQIKNLLSTALETRSVELIQNFVRFQMGRDTRAQSWRYEQFGARLIKDLDALEGDAQRLAEAVRREVSGEELSPRQVARIRLRLARQYLGQLNRYFYYRKEETRWPEGTS